MLTTEPKVHPDSDYYLYTPGRQAQRAFLYPLIVGYFQYEPGYSLKRQALDSFLLIYIKAGSCTVHLNGRSYTARADQIIFLTATHLMVTPPQKDTLRNGFILTG